MKRISLLIVALSAAICSFSQSSPQINGEVCTGNGTCSAINDKPSSSQTASVASFRKASAEMAAKYARYEGDYRPDKCHLYRHMKITGIVLTAVGAGLLTGGIIVAGAARNANDEGNISNNDYYNAVNGGNAMIGLGIVGLGAGIPLTVVGVVKGHEYCDRPYYSTLELNSGHDGMGLALNF